MSDSQKNSGSLWVGLLMIALGVLFLLDRFHLWDFSRIFRDWWPSILILVGFVQLFTGNRRRWTGPLVLIVVGVIFQVDRLDLFRWWDMGTMWPLILIAVGAGILLKRLGARALQNSNSAEAKG